MAIGGIPLEDAVLVALLEPPWMAHEARRGHRCDARNVLAGEHRRSLSRKADRIVTVGGQSRDASHSLRRQIAEELKRHRFVIDGDVATARGRVRDSDSPVLPLGHRDLDVGVSRCRGVGLAATQAIVIDLLCTVGKEGKLTTQKAQQIVEAAHDNKYREALRGPESGSHPSIETPPAGPHPGRAPGKGGTPSVRIFVFPRAIPERGTSGPASAGLLLAVMLASVGGAGQFAYQLKTRWNAATATLFLHLL